MDPVNQKPEDLEVHFQDYLWLKGYKIIKMEPDNNCLFHALSAAANEQYTDYMDVLTHDERMKQQMTTRDKIYNAIRSRQDYYGEFIVLTGIDGITPEKEKDLHIRKLLEEGYSGGKESIVAAADVFQRTIILEKPIEEPFIVRPEFGGVPITLAYHDNHYDLLKFGDNLESSDPKIIQVHFKEFLNLTNKELFPMAGGMDNPYNAIAEVFKDNSKRGDFVRSELKAFYSQNVETFKNKLMEKVPETLKTCGDSKTISEFIENYVNDEFNRCHLEGDFLIYLASQFYRKAIIVLRPLDVSIRYLFNNGGINTAKYLALQRDNRYDVVKNRNTDNAKNDDEVIFVYRTDKPGTEEDSPELNFIQANIFRNMRSEVIILVMVPKHNPTCDTLFEALQQTNPKEIQFLVLYNKSELNKIKQDKELVKLMTLYTFKLNGPFETNMLRRTKWLANLILPPLFLTMRRWIWKGVTIQALSKFSPNSIPVLLLTHHWADLKDTVMTELQKLTDNQDEIFFDNCEIGCTLTDCQTHYNINSFIREPFHKDPKLTKTMDRYDIFENRNTGVHKIIKEMQRLCSEPGKDAIEEFINFMDNFPKPNVDWYTYLVLHVDGPNMEKYAGNSMYYEMVQDNSSVKSVYIGKSGNAEFRNSHYTKSSSLSKIFTKTSRLFLLRNMKCDTLQDAMLDESRVIEIITTQLRGCRKEGKKPEYLFLNVHSQPMELLQEATTSNSNRWAEIAKKRIPLLRTVASQKHVFDNFILNGNFGIEQGKELDVLKGSYSERNFDDVKDVYLLIKARQP